MTYATASINPFPAVPNRRAAALRPDKPDRPVDAWPLQAPITGSPIPHLTRTYHFHRAGEDGDRIMRSNTINQPCHNSYFKTIRETIVITWRGDQYEPHLRKAINANGKE